ncbi:LysR family transcriptional regulator [Marinobacterium sp. CAU 1594]|nr:LysR substrate-binding domain-containing protein [Marinobacterium arenosum]MBY4678128.1 LysR family transcriptional regulator [Marinobacterium arenosum]
MTVKQLRAFVAVAKTQSFTEACAAVHLSQPALSIAIKNLEEEIGGNLLVRTTRTLSLSPEGEAFLPTAQRLLADWDNALEEVHNRFALRRGKVAIAAMPSFALNQLPLAMLRYREKYPQINVTVHDVLAEDVVEMVRNGRVEVGVSFDPGESEDLLFEPLFQDRLVAVLPVEHPLLQHDSISWRQLLEGDFIALQRPSNLRLLIEQQLEEQGISLAVEFETHQLATIGRMAATGLGVGAVPSLCIRQMREMGAHCRTLVEPEISRQVGVITRRRYPLSMAAQAMVQVLRDMSLQELIAREGQAVGVV